MRYRLFSVLFIGIGIGIGFRKMAGIEKYRSRYR